MTLVVAVLMQALSACAINHHVADDYPQYLENNRGESKLPSAKNIKAEYWLTPETEKFTYKFRSFAAGYGNRWIVEFGKMLDQTLQSKDLQEAFGKLEKRGTDSRNVANLITFELIEYDFSKYAAHIELKISLARNGTDTFTKVYQSTGNGQAGKMWTGGVFAMKNSIQQSTKHALDEILKNFLNDIKNRK